ncbi:MAG: hypothetical protein B9S32_11515 [Verrucomicrobia bacterium Tous-C9LFEB]|nr:MAG: hypothetical protein B9S32_11515 [Verrucomicrobia bacterium Tous-C9LFEB]
MGDIKIGLVVDNPYRDLPGMVLLARELALQGACCHLIPYNLRDTEVWSLAPDFLLLNFLRKINEDWTLRLVEADLPFGVLDTEGSVFSPIPTWAVDDLATAEHILDKNQPEIIDYLVTVARKAEIRQSVACYLAWSQGVKDFLVSHGLYNANQVKVTGSPRTDMLTPRFRAAAQKISNYAEDYPKPLVLINASFPTANPAFLTAQQEIDLMVKAFKYNRKFCEDSVKTQTVSLRGIARMANDLAQAFPQATFILRPHPFESTNTYTFLLDDRPNLKLIKMGTVDGWLQRASALIQVGSSTAVEASVLSVPVFTPGWLPLHVPVPVSTLASVEAADIESMKSYLFKVLHNQYEPTAEKKDQIQQAIAQSYGPIDGLAYQRAAHEILAVCRSAKVQRNLNRCRTQLFFTMISGPKWRRKLRALTCSFGHLGIHWNWAKLKNDYRKKLPWDQSEKRFDAVQTQQILDAIETAQPSGFRTVKARQSMRADYHFGYREGRSVIIESM